MKWIWFQRDSVSAVKFTCCSKLQEICVWMVAKPNKRPWIWTCSDFANCLGQMQIFLHWRKYSFNILPNLTKQKLISCGLNWQCCITTGWHFSLLLYWGEAESATNTSELCCSIHSHFYSWTFRNTWSADMLQSDEIISLHLSEIFCGCKSLLNVEAVHLLRGVCHPCEEYLCNAAMGIDLVIPMALALACSTDTDKAGTDTGKLFFQIFWGGNCFLLICNYYY